MSAPMLSRREFAKAAGAIVVAFSLAPVAARAEGPAKLPGSLDQNRMLDAWIRIDADGAITLLTGKVELGQGAMTALAQILAEELDVPVARLQIIAGDTEKTPNEGHTSGSQSIEYGGTALRLAGAEARQILIERAAQKFGVAAAELKTEGGAVVAADGRKASYGELAAADMLHREASAKVPPKAPESYKIVGTSTERLDIPAKVTGGAIFVQDLRMPGMLHGRVVRPPSYHAKLVSYDEKTVGEAMGKLGPEAISLAVVRDGNFLGVIAEREEWAVGAREALRKSVKWSETPDLPADIFAFLRSAQAEVKVVNEKKGTPAAAAKTLEATYNKQYTAHASIGPSCAVAHFVGGKMEVWSHTQGVYPLRQDLASALGMDEKAVVVHHVQGSGCYGHNGADDVALDAALLARAAQGRPVRVQWMRDDEHLWEPFGSAMTSTARAGLGPDGSIVEWRYDVWSNTHSTRPGDKGGNNLLAAWHLEKPLKAPPPRALPQPAGGGDRNAVPTYDFPVQTITNHLVIPMPIRVSAMRTLGGFHNVFAVECFMDELAAAAGADPVEFRLKHLKDPRAKAVISAAAEAAGWKPGAKGDGERGRGVGFAKYKTLATYVAVVADVTVDRKTGDVQVTKLVAAADAGLIINPDGLKNQIEGGAIQAIGWTLREQVGFDGQRVTSRDWVDYPIMTFPEIPPIEIVLIDRLKEKPLGSGEASSGPTGAAIGNAIFHAAGVRLRDLPLLPDKVKAAIG